MPATRLITFFGLLFVDLVRSHGGVWSYDIEGTRHEGNNWLNDSPQDTIQRRWLPYPLYNYTDPHILCNDDGATATRHARIQAGSNITANYFNYHAFDNPEKSWYASPDRYSPCSPENVTRCENRYIGQYWYHTNGPMFVYLAACPAEGCQGFQPSGKIWFKIAQEGFDPKYELLQPEGWFQNQLCWKTGMQDRGWNVTIPGSLKKGYYLVRHEVVNIDGGGQDFVNCAQLEVIGEGQQTPGEEYLVDMTKAYVESDLHYPRDMYTHPHTFVMPGPNVWTGAH